MYEPIGWVREPAPTRLRIGLLTRSLLGREASATVRQAVAHAAEGCAALGHTVVEIQPPAIDGPALSHAFFASAARTVAGVVAMVTPLLGRPPGPDELEPFTLELAAWAATLPPSDDRLTETFAAATAAYVALFAEVDVVLSPTLGDQPWKLGTLAPDLGREELIRGTEELVGFTPIHNVSGCPAMSVPLEDHDGLPVGVQFAAAPSQDARLLALAYELEAAFPWNARRPNDVIGV